ncbi:DUF1622 domain-containing protein [Tropicibacter sp. R16_0]|uniref:DUF1622 domain-containing protein n=1 Tax=Tropicibacter sp. R16_0 TaxID=2821102 RepID=UPI001ADA80BC|nr:DUF1622 domain-containing protein [Tropicibacter sp. R16_0]MBO9453130.1 DUF1622 domain-containing protein [Tropicibacter sp. R16_0]
MHGVETLIVQVASWLQIIFEASSVLVVAAGGVAFVTAFISERTSNAEPRARRTLGKYLIIALEFQLAADIIATATDPSIEELAKLTAIAFVRTFLDYFLVREIREERVEDIQRAKAAGSETTK